MPAQKKSPAKSALKVKDMKAKKNPKGGTINFAKNTNAVDRKSGGDPKSSQIIAI